MCSGGSGAGHVKCSTWLSAPGVLRRGCLHAVITCDAAAPRPVSASPPNKWVLIQRGFASRCWLARRMRAMWRVSQHRRRGQRPPTASLRLLPPLPLPPQHQWQRNRSAPSVHPTCFQRQPSPGSRPCCAAAVPRSSCTSETSLPCRPSSSLRPAASGCWASGARCGLRGSSLASAGSTPAHHVCCVA